MLPVLFHRDSSLSLGIILEQILELYLFAPNYWSISNIQGLKLTATPVSSELHVQISPITELPFCSQSPHCLVPAALSPVLPVRLEIPSRDVVRSSSIILFVRFERDRSVVPLIYALTG